MVYIVGNWKSNQTQTQARIWLDSFASIKPQINTSINTVLCLPFTDIADANRFLLKKPLPLHLGAQDVSSFSAGSHTGQVNASMLAELVSFCLVGHSERRHEVGETSEEVKNKIINLLKHNITPIICLDTPYLNQQIKLLLQEKVDLDSCIFAYEPACAIGSGSGQDPLKAERVCAQISFLVGLDCPVLYGGSVDSKNINKYLSQDHISGVLVGGQSLSPDNFCNLLQSVKL